MSCEWRSDRGFLMKTDGNGYCWRWDAYQNDKQGGWVREAKYDENDVMRSDR